MKEICKNDDLLRRKEGKKLDTFVWSCRYTLKSWIFHFFNSIFHIRSNKTRCLHWKKKFSKKFNICDCMYIWLAIIKIRITQQCKYCNLVSSCFFRYNTRYSVSCSLYNIKSNYTLSKYFVSMILLVVSFSKIKCINVLWILWFVIVFCYFLGY